MAPSIQFSALMLFHTASAIHRRAVRLSLSHNDEERKGAANSTPPRTRIGSVRTHTNSTSLLQRRHSLRKIHGLQNRTTMQAALVTGPNSEPCNFLSVSADRCKPHFERIRVQSLATPSPRPGHALIEVRASSVNPSDWKDFVNPPPVHYPMGFGQDFSGIVVSTGGDCEFQPGDEVWGLGHSAYQEYLVQPCPVLGLKPSNFNFLEAGASVVVAQTGYTALRWAGAPWATAPTVLVIGGSSGTGHVGIQLAKALGAGKVVTTCSPQNFDFVRRLGADEAIDYRQADWWADLKPGSIDVIYDCMGLPGTGNMANSVLSDHGKFVTLQEVGLAREPLSRFDTEQRWVQSIDVETRHLDDIRRFAEGGRLVVEISKVFTGLGSVPELLDTSMQGHTVGKAALQISKDL